MPVDSDLVTYLDPLIAESAGVDLVEGPMPEDPDNCVALTHYTSESARDFRVMAPSLTPPGVEIARVQLMVRNTDKVTARTKAYLIHGVLDGLITTVLSGRMYHQIEAIDGEPSCLGQDQNGRWRYVVSYRVVKARG